MLTFTYSNYSMCSNFNLLIGIMFLSQENPDAALAH